jgi:hypothetical protein
MQDIENDSTMAAAWAGLLGVVIDARGFSCAVPAS